MSRNLRLTHLPSEHSRIRFSGYLTVPSLTDQGITDALSSFLSGIKLWRDPSKLPPDWPTRDEVAPPPGRTAIWGEGDDVSSVSVIGDPETPWRLVVGSGQLVIDNVWLFDAKADPWPTALAPCPTCPPCFREAVRPPVRGVSPTCNATAIGVFGTALGGVLGATAVWMWK
jgi:hypothetical protein